MTSLDVCSKIVCESYQKGASHTRRGAQHCSGQCSLCKAKVVKAVYYEETEDSAYQRMTKHASSIKNEAPMHLQSMCNCNILNNGRIQKHYELLNILHCYAQEIKYYYYFQNHEDT